MKESKLLQESKPLHLTSEEEQAIKREERAIKREELAPENLYNSMMNFAEEMAKYFPGWGHNQGFIPLHKERINWGASDLPTFLKAFFLSQVGPTGEWYPVVSTSIEGEEVTINLGVDSIGLGLARNGIDVTATATHVDVKMWSLTYRFKGSDPEFLKANRELNAYFQAAGERKEEVQAGLASVIVGFVQEQVAQNAKRPKYPLPVA